MGALRISAASHFVWTHPQRGGYPDGRDIEECRSPPLMVVPYNGITRWVLAAGRRLKHHEGARGSAFRTSPSPVRQPPGWARYRGVSVAIVQRDKMARSSARKGHGGKRARFYEMPDRALPPGPLRGAGKGRLAFCTFRPWKVKRRNPDPGVLWRRGAYQKQQGDEAVRLRSPASPWAAPPSRYGRVSAGLPCSGEQDRPGWAETGLEGNCRDPSTGFATGRFSWAYWRLPARDTRGDMGECLPAATL